MRDDQDGNTEYVRCRACLIKDKQHSDGGNSGTGGCFYCSHCAHRDSLYEPLKYLLSSAYVPRTKLRSSRFYRRKRRHELSMTGFRFCQQQHYVCFSLLSVLLHNSLWCVTFLAHLRASFHFFALFWACCPYFVNVEMIHNVNIFFSSACALGYSQTVLTALLDMSIPFLAELHQSAQIQVMSLCKVRATGLLTKLAILIVRMIQFQHILSYAYNLQYSYSIKLIVSKHFLYHLLQILPLYFTM